MGKPILETENYSIRWYDDKGTIILARVTDRWSWDDAHHAIQRIIDTITHTHHDVYTIFLFESVSMVPRGGSALTNLKNMISIDPPNEQMIFIVGGGSFFKSLMQIVGKMGIMRQTFAKYHFVEQLEQALTAIKAHKREAKQNV